VNQFFGIPTKIFPHAILAFLFWAGVCLCVWYVGTLQTTTASSLKALEPLPANAPDLHSVFAKNSNVLQARYDAGLFAEFCYSFADGLELDGQQPPPQRLVKIGLDLAEARSASYWVCFCKVKLGDHYPDLGNMVGNYLSATTPAITAKRDEVFTDEKRLAWIHAMRVLGLAAEHARRKL
jgi:hypothetical protein